jgi:predicted NBD/HSP70 family sugar kinase
MRIITASSADYIGRSCHWRGKSNDSLLLPVAADGAGGGLPSGEQLLHGGFGHLFVGVAGARDEHALPGVGCIELPGSGFGFAAEEPPVDPTRKKTW